MVPSHVVEFGAGKQRNSSSYNYLTCATTWLKPKAMLVGEIRHSKAGEREWGVALEH